MSDEGWYMHGGVFAPILLASMYEDWPSAKPPYRICEDYLAIVESVPVEKKPWMERGKLEPQAKPRTVHAPIAAAAMQDHQLHDPMRWEKPL